MGVAVLGVVIAGWADNRSEFATMRAEIGDMRGEIRDVRVRSVTYGAT